MNMMRMQMRVTFVRKRRTFDEDEGDNENEMCSKHDFFRLMRTIFASRIVAIA